jgi:hypothetical protein
MEELKELIKMNRPKLAESSIKTYCNCVHNIFVDIFPHTEFNYKLFFADYEKVLKYLQSIKFNVRKTILSALVVICQGAKEHVLKAYRDQMVADAQQYNTLIKTHTMTPQMKDNWISWDDIIKHTEEYKNKVWWVWNEKKPSIEHLLELQKYIILKCYTDLPPRRNLDFCAMKVKDYDKKTDNYYEKGTFYFNVYKTAKTYNLQTEKLPKSLDFLIKKWIKLADCEYLFFDFYKKPLVSSGMSKIFNTIFKKNISVNMLRHSYITCKLGPKMKELEEAAAAMGHSTSEQKNYVKDIKDE